MTFRHLLFILLYLSALSFSFSHTTFSLSTSRRWLSRKFDVFSDRQHVPRLESGESLAREPENISDLRAPSPTPTSRDQNLERDFPSASSEISDGEVRDPRATSDGEQGEDTTEPSPHFSLGDDDGKEAPFQKPSSNGGQSPESAIIVDPISETEGPQPNSQQILSGSQDLGTDNENDESVQIPEMSELPSASSSSTYTPTRPGVSGSHPQSSVEPLPSAAPLRPSEPPRVSVSASPDPSFVTNTSSTETEETDIPTPSLSMIPSPSSTFSRNVPSPSISENPSSPRDPSPSTSKMPSMSASPMSSVIQTLSPSPSVSAGSGITETPLPSSSVSSGVSGRPSPTQGDVTESIGATAIPPAPDLSESSSIPPSPSEFMRPSSPVSPVSSVPSATPRPTGLVSEYVMTTSPVPSFTVVLPNPPSTSPEITVVLPAPPSSAVSSPGQVSPSTTASASADVSSSPNVFPSATASPPAVSAPSMNPSPPVPSFSPPPSSGGTDIIDAPQPGDSFECLYFGTGLLTNFSAPELALFNGTVSQFKVSKKKFPDLSPQYLSHTYGKSWSYSVPVKSGVAYDFVLAFAEVYDKACSAGPDGSFREFMVSVQDQEDTLDVMKEVGCGTPLKKPYSGIVTNSDSVLVSLSGIEQNAFLNTLCYRPVTDATKTPQPSPPSSPILSPPPPSSPTPSTSSDDNIVGPDSSYQCISFGPVVINGYTPFNPEFVSGSTSTYLGSEAIQNPSLPLAYRYHVFGEQWTYKLNISSLSPQTLVLGFAEVFAEACATGTDGGFRVFTINVGSQARVLDIMNSVGCAVVEQVLFEDIAPVDNTIDISFSAIKQQAMLSVLCYKDAESISPIGTNTPKPTAVPTNVPSSPEPSKEGAATATLQASSTPSAMTITPTTSPMLSSTPDPSSQESRTCFWFGDEVVEGFFSVQVPGPDSGIEFFSKPLLDVQGTSLDSVYSSHIFGSEFTFSVDTGNIAIKSVELGFAEVYEVACEEDFRVFTVEVGSTTRTLDVYKEAGCSTALDLRFDGVVPSTSGVVDVVFTAVKNLAMVSAVCIIESEIGGNVASGKGPGDSLEDEDANPIAVVSPGRPATSPMPSPSLSTESTPPKSPSPSLFPKENGIIITGPSNTPEVSVVGPGLTNAEHGEGPSPSWTPVASDTLYPSNLTSTTLGTEESLTPLPSPAVSQTPESHSVAAGASPEFGNEDVNFAPNATPSLEQGSEPAEIPEVSHSPVAIIPGEDDKEPSASSEYDNDNFAPNGMGSLSPGKQDTVPAPTITMKPSASPETVATAVPPFSDGSPVPSPPFPSVSGVAPSMPPSPTSIPAPTGAHGSESVTPNIPSTSLSPSGSFDGDTQSPSMEDVDEEEPGKSMEPNSEPSEISPEVAATAVPPVQPSNTTTGDTTGAGPSSGFVIIGAVQGAQGTPGLEASSFAPSPSNATVSAPSPVNSRQPVGILPPVDPSLPSPSALPSVQGSPSPLVSPVSTPSVSVSFPILSAPSPSVSVVSTPSASAPTPTTDASPAVSASADATTSSPSPSPTLDSPNVVPPDQTTPSASAATTTVSPSIATTAPVESPSPSASRVSSTTGSNEVITISTVTPTPPPQASSSPPNPAPAKPVSTVPDNSTAAIGVPEGTDVDEDNEDTDATGDNDDKGPTIIAGPFMDSIGTEPEGNGFKIGMGILGSLLVLLLILCLFFAIFRGRGGSYSYSSDYSAHKPTDDDPSHGGYTNDLGLGTGPGDGEGSLYNGGVQYGLGGGDATLESRPQTQNGSFTYEGAEEGLGGTIGSQYGLEPRVNDAELGDGTAYVNQEPDNFPEYSSLNIPNASGIERSEERNNGSYSFNETFPLQAESAYASGVSNGGQDRSQEQGETMPGSGFRPFKASSSSNAYHSIARPMAHESESSGKQERTMESVAYGEGPWRTYNGDGLDVDSRYSDVRDSRAESLSSAPSAAQSPYEQNIHVDIVHDTSGNVLERFPESSRFLATGMRGAGISGTVANGGAIKSPSRVVTEPRADDFLCNEETETNARGEFAARTTEDMFPRHRPSVDDASVEGPWPTWWSESKRNLVATGKYTGREAQTPEGHSGNGVDDSDEHGKENDVSSYEAKRSIFENHSDEASSATRTTEQRSAEPLGLSSKANLVVDEAQQFAPDSGWLRFSRTSRKSDQAEDDDGDLANYDELRKRRQPYVKSIASRLSVGAQSNSTSITRESVAGQAGKPSEREQFDMKQGPGRNSSSWITHAPIEI